MWARVEGIGAIQTNATGRCATGLDSVTFLGVLSACASVLQLKHAGLLINRPFKVVASQMPLWGMGSLTCISNVEVWKYEGHFKSVQQFAFMQPSHLDYYA
jgi:hypothetical protein